jgi:DNA-binding CsgD family transcriptional regulator
VISIRLFNKNDGLPAKLPYHLNKIDHNLVITTDHGVFVYDSLHRTFSPSQKYNDFFQSNNQISQLIIDSQNNRWYFANKRMGVYRLLEDGSYIEISIPFLKFSNSLVTSYEHLFPYDHNNVFIATQSGFVHYNPSFTKDYNTIYNTYIRRVRLLKLTSDSILAYQGNKGISDQAIMEQFSIPFRYNSLSFEFSAPFYEDPDKTEYRYRLLGYEDTWSPWDSRSIKEYTNLPDGRYTFEVQAINLYKSIGINDSYSFYIKPPFYKTKVAYVFYILLFIIIMVGNILYFKRRIERTRLKEKLAHDKKVMALQHEFKEESAEANEKIEQLRSEKLISEIKHKNKELANSTMHLIQKNKFLNVIKDEINKVVEENSPISQKNALQRLLRHIDKDLNNEKHSKVFDEYFDDVHQDFLARMKEKHRALTPKELRLCAYLRMNLASKEIATLMNISIRGVEVSRYRLRKKLDLERDTNLTEYILNF